MPRYSNADYADAIADVLCYHRGLSDAAAFANLSVGLPPETITKLQELKKRLLKDAAPTREVHFPF